MNTSNFTLYLFISSDDEVLKELYKKISINHNHKVNNPLPDSGFDLFIPTNFAETFSKNNNNLITTSPYSINTNTLKMPHNVKCAMLNNKTGQYHGYYLYPRSSIVKTGLRLANSVGIIDAGYRGEIIAVVDNIDKNFTMNVTLEGVKKYDRLFQICAPDLSAFYVKIVENEEELGQTERGEGGFGSTGK